MNTQANTQAQTGQNQTPTIEDLQPPFFGLCFAAGSILGDKLSNGDLLYRLQWLIDDSQKMADIALALKNKILDGETKPQKQQA